MNRAQRSLLHPAGEYVDHPSLAGAQAARPHHDGRAVSTGVIAEDASPPVSSPRAAEDEIPAWAGAAPPASPADGSPAWPPAAEPQGGWRAALRASPPVAVRASLPAVLRVELPVELPAAAPQDGLRALLPVEFPAEPLAGLQERDGPVSDVLPAQRGRVQAVSPGQDDRLQDERQASDALLLPPDAPRLPDAQQWDLWRHARTLAEAPGGPC